MALGKSRTAGWNVGFGVDTSRPRHHHRGGESASEGGLRPLKLQ